MKRKRLLQEIKSEVTKERFRKLAVSDTDKALAAVKRALLRRGVKV